MFFVCHKWPVANPTRNNCVFIEIRGPSRVSFFCHKKVVEKVSHFGHFWCGPSVLQTCASDLHHCSHAAQHCFSRCRKVSKTGPS